MTEDKMSQLPAIGYLFHYPTLDHPHEKFRLEIFLSSKPTEKHFDVLKVCFSALIAHGPVNSLQIAHPWELTKNIHVCAGPVTMEDRNGIKEVGYTFGGQLSVHTKELQTVCSLVSTAPILHYTDFYPVQKDFIEEIEILLAEQLAEYHDQENFLDNVCRADPLSLYQSCLNVVRVKMENLQTKGEEYEQLLVYVNREEHRLHAAGLLKHPSPSLQDIFPSSG